MAAFLVTAMQSSVLAAYAIDVHNQTGRTAKFISVKIPGYNPVTVGNIRNGGHARITVKTYVSSVSVLVGFMDGSTATYNGLKVDRNANVYVR